MTELELPDLQGLEPQETVEALTRFQEELREFAHLSIERALQQTLPPEVRIERDDTDDDRNVIIFINEDRNFKVILGCIPTVLLDGKVLTEDLRTFEPALLTTDEMESEIDAVLEDEP